MPVDLSKTSVSAVSGAAGQAARTDGTRVNRRRVKRPPADEIANTVRQLSILIRAGVPLVEVLEGLADGAKSDTLRECLEEMTFDVTQGSALSECFAKRPDVFPPLAAQMSRIAETGGNLAESMQRLADHMETGVEITRKVKSALAYPVVVMIISVITVIVMVTFILPRFVTLFNQMGAQLPWSTRMLMSISDTMTSRWYVFLTGAAAVYYLFKSYAASSGGRRRIDSLVLKLPLVGDVVTKIVLSRVLASMSTLLSSGVPMVQTLETAGQAANNEVVKRALLRTSREVAEGASTSQSLRDSGTFPPVVLQMVASGEKTGDLPEMLNHVQAWFERETDARIKALTSTIEPVMIVVLGVIVGFIAISVIVPIYSLVGGVK